MIFNCPRCNYSTNSKNSILRHINKKNVCELSNNGLNIDVKKYEDIIIYKANPLDIIKICEKEYTEIYKLEQKLVEKENEIIDLKKRLMKYEKSGYIYVLHNATFESWGDNIYKIGCSNDPERRLKDFATSYLSESSLVYKSKLFNNKLKAEQELFKLIDNYRSSSKREFFDIPLDTLVSYIENINI